MFNTAFNDFISPEKASLDYYPANLRTEIDTVNEWIYPNINSKLPFFCPPLFRVTFICVSADGVYRAGFAASQEAYEKAVHDVFSALDKAEKILAEKDYLVGNKLTEADIRLWVTIVSGIKNHH
jgi:glutathionyl-hydroquinone reductase